MLGSKVSYFSVDGSTEFIINDRASIDVNFRTGNPYYIQLTSVEGLRGADISYESDPLPNETGEISGDVIRRGKGITLGGKIWALNRGALEQGTQYLEQMFWEVSGLRKLAWWFSGTDHTSTGARVYVKCRVNNDLVVTESLDGIGDINQTSNWNWVVGLRADDPRIYNITGDTIFKSWQT